MGNDIFPVRLNASGSQEVFGPLWLLEDRHAG